MDHRSVNIIITLATLFTIACGQSSIDARKNSGNKHVFGTGKLVPIDLSDTIYKEFRRYAIDTSTIDGWKINYLVKDDSTKYTDLYIQWTKNSDTGIYFMGDVLLMRPYFIPIFVGENKSRLFLSHGCATTCSAILVLSKDSVLNGIDFPYVINYDIKNGQLVYIPEKSYTLDTLEVSVVDLFRAKEKSIVFDNICDLRPEEGCIDSVCFDKDFVKIFATLIDKRDTKRVRRIKESHIVNF